MQLTWAEQVAKHTNKHVLILAPLAVKGQTIKEAQKFGIDISNIEIWNYEQLDNMNPQKLFNYILQGLETANNVRILEKMIRLLRGKNTQIVLYTYDAFLLDWDESEDILNDILNIFKQKGLQTKLSYGESYDFTQL